MQNVSSQTKCVLLEKDSCIRFVFQYLDALAQQRLCNNVREEVDSFLKGLNGIIPDNLLSIFDENELELLLCGTGEYSISEFRMHHIANGNSAEFRKVNSNKNQPSSYLKYVNICNSFSKVLELVLDSSKQLQSNGNGQITPIYDRMLSVTTRWISSKHFI